MSTIGLDKLYFAEITDGPSGETYGTPYAAPGVQSADLKLNIQSAKNYADDGTWEVVNEFIDGTITLGVADLGTALASKLTGAVVDGNGVLISANEDEAKAVAMGFRSLHADHTYEYVWLYKVTFAAPGHTYNTKGESITFNNSTIEGTIERRKKPDAFSRHPWRSHADERSTPESVISGWFDAVYEPSSTIITITTQPEDTEVTAGSITGSLTAAATASSGSVTWQWYQNTTPNNYGGTPVESGTSASLTIPSTLTAGTYYFYAVATAGGSSKPTNVATVTVEAAS